MSTFTQLYKLISLGLVAMLLTGASDEWPPLPSKGFIRSRAATKQDVDNNNALFVLDENGKSVGKPAEIIIPQYVYVEDSQKYGILIQAEDAPDGMRFYGVRLF